MFDVYGMDLVYDVSFIFFYGAMKNLWWLKRFKNACDVAKLSVWNVNKYMDILHLNLASQLFMIHDLPDFCAQVHTPTYPFTVFSCYALNF